MDGADLKWALHKENRVLGRRFAEPKPSIFLFSLGSPKISEFVATTAVPFSY